MTTLYHRVKQKFRRYIRKTVPDNVVEYGQPPLLPQDFDDKTIGALDAALCADCRGLELGRLVGTGPMPVNPYVADFSASASSEGCLRTTLGQLSNSSLDCACCKLMLECLVQDAHMRNTSLDTQLMILFHDQNKIVEIYPERNLKLRTTLRAMYFDDWEPTTNVAGGHALPIPRLLQSHLTTDQVSDRIQSWLNLCQKECRFCHVGDSDTLMPSRLLDVGRDSGDVYLTECSNHVSVKGNGLALSTGHGARIYANRTIRYVALSYCWGTAGQYTLNRSTHADLLRGISPNILPRTIQDAIKLTRGLGVRFLWIDALCILQGADEHAQKDWQEQSAMMSTIYKNAYLTIIASRSASVQEGFLQSRDTNLLGVYCGSFQGPNGRKPIFLYHTGSRSPYLDELLRDEPLTTRGWAFQERILSSRSVYFGSKQMYWNCGGGERAEDDDRMVSQGENRHSIWTAIVADYTSCRLTKATDRLPALAGLAKFHLAKHIPSVRGDEYCAGHWREDLLQSLFWHPPPASTGVLQAFEYQAPSWSWASCNGPIEWDMSASGELVATLIDVRVMVQGANPFGHVNGGWLDIEAPIMELPHGILHLTQASLVATGQSPPRAGRFPIELNPLGGAQDQYRIWRPTEDQLKALFPLDAKRIEEVYTLERMQLHSEYSDPHPSFVFDLPEYTQLEDICLAAMYRSDALGNDDSERVHGLILHATPQDSGTYRRIGLFSHLGDFVSRHVKPNIIRII